MRVERRRCWALAVLFSQTVLLCLVAAAPVPAGRGRPQDLDADILELDGDMAKFLVKHVSTRQSPSAQVSALIDAFFGKKGLDITYDSTTTLTARETFKKREGNCLSFTILFVAMARHLGLNAYFEEVGEVISWDRRGELVIRNQHMVVEIELDNGHRRVDFLPEASRRYRLIRRISDQRALAHYHNNLGVDALANGDVDGALERFEAALAADPDFSYAWTNQGVAERRLRDFDAAERSHLRALEITPNETSALANLASLYLGHGMRDQAEPLMRKAEAALDRNPFHHYRQGLLSAREDSWELATRHFREAIRRMPEEPRFHAALGKALHHTGETVKARQAFEKALALSADDEERRQIHDDLTALGLGS